LGANSAARSTVLSILFSGALILASSGWSSDISSSVGEPARFFITRDIQGEPFVFSRSTVGKSFCILSFFSPDCEPCVREMPEIDRLVAERYSEVKLFFIGIDRVNSIRNVRDFVQPLGLLARVLFDEKGKISGLYHVDAVPALVAIDAELKIAYRSVGYQDGDLSKLEKFLNEQLRGGGTE
jgi:thiol-disulfide isomerase/thioredoxin